MEDELQFLSDCPWETDLSYVRQICEEIDVPLEVVPMQKEYFEKVVGYTIEEVKAGRTPNPDIMCNSLIKFGLFLDKVSADFDKVASGHYAQVEEVDEIMYLKKSPDPVKDQTYFLARLNQDQLKKLLCPIGGLAKTEVRELAEKYDLPNKDRKDSQGICFLGKFKYNDFIKNYLGEKKGDIVEFETGQKIGEHEGFWYHTVGQRKGIGLSGGPWYVVKKDSEKNIVYVSSKYFDEEKVRNKFKVENYNWFAGKAPSDTSGLEVKIRHGENIYRCKLDLSINEVELLGNDQGIAAGQFAVFYKKDLCIGSAMISD